MGAQFEHLLGIEIIHCIEYRRFLHFHGDPDGTGLSASAQAYAGNPLAK